MIRAALGALRSRLGAIVGAWLILLAAVPMSFCLLGLPFVGRTLGRLAYETLRGAREVDGKPAPKDPEKSFAGWIAALGALAFCVALELVLAATSHTFRDAPELVELGAMLCAGALACVGIAAAMAPLLLAPFNAVAGVSGFFAPFFRSFEIAARRGPKPTLQLGATIGALFAVAFIGAGLAFYALSTRDGLDSVYVAAPVSVLFAIPFAFALLATSHVRHASEAEHAPPPMRSRLRGLAWMLAPAFLAFGVTFVVAALTPAQMEEIPAQTELRRGFHTTEMGMAYGSGRIPGTSVSLRTTPRGLVIEAEDGGGAGEVEAGFDVTPAAFYVRERVVNDERTGQYVVVITDGDRWARTIVDRDGVRLDDSMAERTFGRLGQVGTASLSLSLVLLLLLTFTLGAELGAARTLTAPSLLDEGSDGSGALRGLEGTLRIGEASKVRFSPASLLARTFGNETGRLTVDGEAWLEADGGSLRIRLPAHPIAVLGGRPGDEWNGEQVVLLSRFEKGVTSGLRESSASFPEDGRFTLGTARDASEVLVERAVRRASFIVLPVLAGVFVASVFVLAGL